MSKTRPHRLQEFRFRLKPDALAEQEIAILQFPWERAVNEFIACIERGRGNTIKYKERPPFQSLNAALVALSTTLVHGFEKYTLSDDENEGTIKSRFLLAPVDTPRPGLDKIALVVQSWLKGWIEDTFKDELKDSIIAQAYQVLLDTLTGPETDWQKVRVGALLPDHPFIFQAIPSVLAKYLLKQSEEINIEGNPVRLCLAKSVGKGSLILVSDPVPSDAGGSFAYVLFFRVHTVPGDSMPFIQFHLSCRRYMEKKVKRLNFKRKSTVMVSLKAPLLEGWPFDPTLVPLQVDKKGDKIFWDDATRHLLEDINIRPLVAADALAENPRHYWDTDEKYYWLYAEGMKPPHPLGSGFSPGELYRVWQHVVHLTEAILTPEDLIECDMQTHNTRRPAAMLTTWELMEEGNRQVPVFEQAVKTRVLTLEDKETLKQTALQRAIGAALPYLLILYRTEDGLAQLRDFAKLCLPTNLPDTRIIEHRTEDSLTATFNEDASERDYQVRRIAWNKLLKLLRPPQEHPALALIEVPPEHFDNDDETLKGIIRQVCLSHQIASQLFVQPTGEEGDKSRAKNAATDLLIRQPGVVYDDICNIYRLAGIPENVANQLTVIGLYRKRTIGEHPIDFPLAVRLLPSGRVEMCWPDKDWTPYYQAALDLGNYFWPNRQQRDKLKLKKEKIQAFVKEICLGIAGPTLILVEAHDFRGVWPLLQNPSLQANQLTLPDGEVRTPEQIKDLRLIRLRSSENDETPQYVRPASDDDDGDPQVERSAAGLYLAGTFGDFKIFHSLGKMPKTTSYQKDYEPKTGLWGGKRAYKHQRILELIPFFMQQDDNVQAWARLAHYLRYTPAWTEGRTVLPLPSHLAVDALEDVLCLL